MHGLWHTTVFIETLKLCTFDRKKCCNLWQFFQSETNKMVSRFVRMWLQYVPPEMKNLDNGLKIFFLTYLFPSLFFHWNAKSVRYPMCCFSETIVLYLQLVLRLNRFRDEEWICTPNSLRNVLKWKPNDQFRRCTRYLLTRSHGVNYI